MMLAVPDGRRRCARCVDRVESTHPLRLSIDVGECTPLYAGAIAKAALAFLDARVIDDVLAHDLKPAGPATLQSRAKPRDELELIRARSWAYSYEETDVGAWGVAAPVLTLGGNLVAVIGVIAPTARHSQVATTLAAAPSWRQPARRGCWTLGFSVTQQLIAVRPHQTGLPPPTWLSDNPSKDAGLTLASAPARRSPRRR